MAGNGFDATPLDWSTITFNVAVPNWNGLQPGSNLQKTIALGLRDGPPPQSNAPPEPVADYYEEAEEVIPPGPEPETPEQPLPEEPPPLA